MTDYNHTFQPSQCCARGPGLPIFLEDTFDEKIISTTQLLVKYIPEDGMMYK